MQFIMPKKFDTLSRWGGKTNELAKIGFKE